MDGYKISSTTPLPKDPKEAEAVLKAGLKEHLPRVHELLNDPHLEGYIVLTIGSASGEDPDLHMAAVGRLSPSKVCTCIAKLVQAMNIDPIQLFMAMASESFELPSPSPKPPMHTQN